jgi:hypothetical protein
VLVIQICKRNMPLEETADAERKFRKIVSTNEASKSGAVDTVCSGLSAANLHGARSGFVPSTSMVVDVPPIGQVPARSESLEP